jgi:diguanylate cyclase (GGDEF)-like protein
MTKILVIEDEDSVRSNIMELLDAEEFDAIEADNGRYGVQLAREESPDLILCDVMMPQLDGYGVLRELRKDPVTAIIPFIFLTAKASRTDWRQGMELGADDYLTKPFSRDELLCAIATRLKKQNAVEQRYSSRTKELEAQLNRLLNTDEITGLPNQRQLRSRLHQIAEEFARDGERDKLVPIVCVDIDRFNRINESLGPSNGDRLLRAIASRLSTCIGSEDFIARLSADQFALILTPVEREDAAANIPQILLNSLSIPFIINGQEIFLSASIGISLYPRNGTDIDTPIAHAETAMFAAREQGGNQYEFYRPQLQISAPERLTLETNLRYAIEREEFEVYYQPQVNLSSGQIIGAEALVRWQHPERGIISPASFIPLAEETGLIIPLGEWVLKTACLQAKAWRDAGFDPLRIAVNLSGRQFSQSQLKQRLIEILEQTELEAQWLELELTETMVVQNIDATIARFQEIRELGIQVSIDDFGTGYSSLSYLQKLPFDTLKIDRCFVRELSSNPKNAALTEAILQMARSLNLQTIAEGVEIQAELKFLCEHHCDAMQGYLYSKPLPAQEFQTLLVSGQRLPIPQSRGKGGA